MNKTIKLYAEFDCMVDTDLAVIKIIQSKYSNSNYMIGSILECNDDMFIRHELLHRKKYNPLSIILKEEYMSSADSLYKEIIDTHMEEILSIAEPNAIGDYIFTLAMVEGVLIEINVACKNELEKKYISDKVNLAKINLINKDATNDLNKYDGIFVKRTLDILFAPEIVEGRRVYIPSFDFNFKEENKINGNIVTADFVLTYVGEACELCPINVYKKSKIKNNKEE